MQKVLSTKLELEEINRFEEIAQREGESKAGLLKRLALDYLDINGKTNMLIPACKSNTSVSPKEDLAAHCKDSQNESLPQVPREPLSKKPDPISLVDNSLLANKDIDLLWKPALLPTTKEPVCHNLKPNGYSPSPKRSSGLAWLIIVGLIVLAIKSESTRVVDPTTAPVAANPYLANPFN